MGVPRRCETELESKSGTGAGSKTAEAMRTATGQWGPCVGVRRRPGQGAGLAVAAKARYVMKVHHVLADPKEETGTCH